MKLKSLVFEHGGKIPQKYTCDGESISPPLFFKNIPESAKSLVLIMDDPDIPTFVKERFKIGVWDHWVVFNIPASLKEVKEGKEPEGILGINTNKKLGYAGPCPPDREHRYFFKLFALDMMLALKEGATKEEVLRAMQGHVLEEAELMGRYEGKK